MSKAVMLISPKYARNVAMVIRACACFGVDRLYFKGKLRLSGRLPREFRMYDTELLGVTRIPDGYTPVAVERNSTFVPLPQFEHPENPLYVFGPEDGDLPKWVLAACHHHVVIPSEHSINLAGAVYITLYGSNL